MSKVHILLVSFGSWPDSFKERVNCISNRVDELYIVKPRTRFDYESINENITVHEVTSYESIFFYPIAVILSIYSILRIRQSKSTGFDVIHSLDYYIGATSALIYSQISGIKHVASIRGLPKPIVQKDHSVLNKFHKIAFYCYFIILFSLSDFIIVKSRSEQNFLVDMRSKWEEKISIIPTGVDLSRFTPRYQESQDKLAQNKLDKSIYDIVSTENYILYLGRINKEKGVLNLVKYFDSLNLRTNLLVIGRASNCSYLDEINKVGIQNDNIHIFPNWIDHTCVPPILRQAEAVALLSKDNMEGAPKIIQESLSVGTPVVASNIPGIRYPFENIDGIYLVDSTQKNEVTGALKQAINTQHVDTNKVHKIFDIEICYDSVKNVYEKALNTE
ncbi:glycosyltransferase family 4 protein [Halorubrum ezzemoulense]|uniref:glycosyltransferase family 4 protein n=1 Tax=Halorubrum ezzemoulense TaxID=337243 RepID=UPI00232E8FCF|nr:glycosyltransferase [Halorubrum ezzemoulense]MDB9235518.1 glycosyltransferase [Halorubrum ezzemoulense]